MGFAIPSRKHTAIVGPSGGGKSTVVSLLGRFHDPEPGDILIAQHKFRDLNVRYVRGNICFVQQEPPLLDRSISENIGYDLVSSAAEKHRHLAPFILDSSLPDLAQRMREGISERDALSHCDSSVSEIFGLARQAVASADALNFIEALKHGFATNVCIR